MTCDVCKELLAEGLGLCVRARQMDAMDRLFDKHVERHNIQNPHAPISTRSGTVRLWIEEQYQTDLAEWEKKSRHHLMQGCGKTIERGAK